jgi:hypothetical protein
MERFKIDTDITMSELKVVSMVHVYGAGEVDVEVMHDNWKELESIEIPKNCRCDCCNKRIKYICVSQHTPTGMFSLIGRDCAKSINILSESEFKYYSKALAERAKLKKNLSKFKEANPELVEMLDWAKESTNTFVRDVYNKLRKYGSLSERQISALVRNFEKSKQPVVETVPVVKGDAPEGRQSIKGNVVSIKEYPSQYSNGYYYKMLVELASGARVFGTIPKHLSDVEKGDTVEFTATFSRSDKDQSFGFYKKPTK